VKGLTLLPARAAIVTVRSSYCHQ